MQFYVFTKLSARFINSTQISVDSFFSYTLTLAFRTFKKLTEIKFKLIELFADQISGLSLWIEGPYEIKLCGVDSFIAATIWQVVRK